MGGANVLLAGVRREWRAAAQEVGPCYATLLSRIAQWNIALCGAVRSNCRWAH